MLDCLIRCKTGHKLYLTNPLSTQVCNTPIWSKRKLQRRCKVHLFTDKVAKVRASTDNTQSTRLRSHTSQLDWHSTSTVYTVGRRHHQLSSTTSWQKLCRRPNTNFYAEAHHRPDRCLSPICSTVHWRLVIFLADSIDAFITPIMNKSTPLTTVPTGRFPIFQYCLNFCNGS